MHGWRKKSLVLVLAAVFVCTATVFPAFAQDVEMEGEPSAPAMILDFLFLRPLGLVSFLGGTAFFIATLPFSWPSGSVKQARHKLMDEPASFTFARPLGKVGS